MLATLFFRHKGGQVSPQNTEVTQFVSSDIDIQADQTAQSSSAVILQGRQGTPAGKLPPIKSSVRNNFKNDGPGIQFGGNTKELLKA